MRNRLLLILLMVGTLAISGLTACGQSSAQGNQTAGSGQGTQENQTTQSVQNTQQAGANSSNTDTSYIGEEKALSIALENAGLTQDQLLYSQVHLDMDDGVWIYDVEFYGDNKEFDYEIDAAAGTILSFDQDMENSFVPGTGTTNSQTGTPATDDAFAVSIETATQTALEKVSGATSDHIRINQEWDDGRAVYEGKIIYNDMEYDFEIDATTGNIISWEAESIYD